MAKTPNVTMRVSAGVRFSMPDLRWEAEWYRMTAWPDDYLGPRGHPPPRRWTGRSRMPPACRRKMRISRLALLRRRCKYHGR